MTGALPFAILPDGLRLSVRVTPRAATDAIDGVEIRDDGRAVLKLRVRALADKGAANAAAVGLVAAAFGLPKAAVRLASGATGRLKTLSLSGDGPGLAAKAQRLLDNGAKNPANRPQKRQRPIA